MNRRAFLASVPVAVVAAKEIAKAAIDHDTEMVTIEQLSPFSGFKGSLAEYERDMMTTYSRDRVIKEGLAWGDE